MKQVISQRVHDRMNPDVDPFPKARALPVSLFAALILLTAFGTCLLAQENASEKFQRAVEHYRAAEYGDAISLLQNLERRGYDGYLLHYNLGNAYYKNGELGRSILHFEKALLYRPGDADVLHNLKVVRARTRDRLESVPLLFFVRWWNTLKSSYTPETFFVASVILLWILAAFLFVFFGFRNILLRRIALVSGMLFGVLFVLSVVLYSTRLEELNARRSAVVMPDEVTVRSTPDASGIESFKVHEGLKVHIMETRDAFYRIRLADGKTGWISASALERI